MIKIQSVGDVDADVAGFGVLYEEFLTPVYRYIWARVGVAEVAEDLAQDVFVGVLRSLPDDKRRKFARIMNGDGEGEKSEVLRYLFVVARCRVIDYWRRRKGVVLEAETLTAVSDKVNQVASVQEEVARADEIAQVMVALRKLSGDDQEILVLRFVSDLSTAEIADVLGKTVVAVRKSQSRALVRLRKILI